MRIILDMDEVVVDMMTPLLAHYNKQYHKNFTIEDIVQWKLPDQLRSIFFVEGFFRYLKPLEGAIETIKHLLDQGCDIVIATNHSDDPWIAQDKVFWVQENLPQLADSMMIGNRKDCLNGDVIIDDRPDYLLNSPCPVKICMDRPWNRWINQGIAKRAYDWNDIRADIEELIVFPLERMTENE